MIQAMKPAVVLAFLCCALSASDEDAKIMRPVDKAAMPSADVDIAATAPNGRLELDGKPVTVEQPFPNVFHANVKTAPGVHKLAIVWEGGRKEIEFFTGANPPAGFGAFHQHPPVSGVQCTQCHELSVRGRFRFKGGCFPCHQTATFAKVHTHNADTLKECGLCHNAHGSTVKANLLMPKETACKQCHD